MGLEERVAASMREAYGKFCGDDIVPWDKAAENTADARAKGRLYGMALLTYSAIRLMETLAQ